MVALLLEAGASHQVKVPQTNWTPLAIAANRGRNKCVKVLLKHGADLNLKAHCENTPLSEACWHGHPEMLKHLIATKGDLEATNNSGYTPFSVAADRGQDDCVRVMIDAGANLEARGWGHKRPE